jgi:hypothetical protein
MTLAPEDASYLKSQIEARFGRAEREGMLKVDIVPLNKNQDHAIRLSIAKNAQNLESYGIFGDPNIQFWTLLQENQTMLNSSLEKCHLQVTILSSPKL